MGQWVPKPFLRCLMNNSKKLQLTDPKDTTMIESYTATPGASFTACCIETQVHGWEYKRYNTFVDLFLLHHLLCSYSWQNSLVLAPRVILGSCRVFTCAKYPENKDRLMSNSRMYLSVSQAKTTLNLRLHHPKCLLNFKITRQASQMKWLHHWRR